MSQKLEPNTREYYAELQKLGVLIQQLPTDMLELDPAVQFSLMQREGILESLRKIGIIVPIQPQ